MKRRAEAQAETRQKIVDAVVALHEEIGPKETTISAIAERAGVQRLTVYRHFPDEEALFNACTSQWAEHNPAPDPAKWQDLDDWEARCRSALGALYSYYEGTRDMWRKSYRDYAEVPALEAPMQGFHDYLGSVRTDLLGTAPAQTEKLEITLSHILSFSTWDSLDGLCQTREQMVELTFSWLQVSLSD